MNNINWIFTILAIGNASFIYTDKKCNIFFCIICLCFVLSSRAVHDIESLFLWNMKNLYKKLEKELESDRNPENECMLSISFSICLIALAAFCSSSQIQEFGVFCKRIYGNIGHSLSCLLQQGYYYCCIFAVLCH